MTGKAPDFRRAGSRCKCGIDGIDIKRYVYLSVSDSFMNSADNGRNADFKTFIYFQHFGAKFFGLIDFLRMSAGPTDSDLNPGIRIEQPLPGCMPEGGAMFN